LDDDKSLAAFLHVFFGEVTRSPDHGAHVHVHARTARVGSVPAGVCPATAFFMNSAHLTSVNYGLRRFLV
jgi:hypothetical protein